jgi:transcriptional antiterminator RfaH
VNSWYVVRTKPRAEFVALGHIERQGFTVYLPHYLRRRRHARRTDWVQAPLFPGYLFVSMDVEVCRWRVLSSTVGVAELICDREWPVPVPASVIDEIRQREDANGIVLLGRQVRLSPGDRVDISHGPLADYSAIFECESDEHRVFVLLDLLGRQVRTCVPLSTISPAA